MAALIIIGAFIFWIFLGLAVFVWMVNRSADIFGGDNAKISFRQIFALENLGDPFFWAMVASSLIWPAVLMVVADAWKRHARRIREMAKYD